MALMQPFCIDIRAERPGGLAELHTSTHAVNLVVLIHLVAVLLALLVGFLLLQHLYHLSISLGQVDGTVDFDAEIVEILLIVALQQIFQQLVTLCERIVAVVKCSFVGLQRCSNIINDIL